jgi:hypothetical protein
MVLTPEGPRRICVTWSARYRIHADARDTPSEDRWLSGPTCFLSSSPRAEAAMSRLAEDLDMAPPPPWSVYASNAPRSSRVARHEHGTTLS